MEIISSYFESQRARIYGKLYYRKGVSSMKANNKPMNWKDINDIPCDRCENSVGEGCSLLRAGEKITGVGCIMYVGKDKRE